jgi:hypothetical protein
LLTAAGGGFGQQAQEAPMKQSLPNIIFAGIVALFLVLVDGGVALIILSTKPGDALVQRLLQDIGAAMVASSPFIFVYQLFGWADAQEHSNAHTTRARS